MDGAAPRASKTHDSSTNCDGISKLMLFAGTCHCISTFALLVVKVLQRAVAVSADAWLIDFSAR